MPPVIESLAGVLGTTPGDRGDSAWKLPDGRLLRVEVKSVRAPRTQDVLGQLAVAVLQVRKGRPGLALVAVELPSFGDGLMKAVEDFMEDHAPELGWALCGRDGHLRVRAPALGLDRDQSGDRIAVPSRLAQTERYSDLNRWLLKVLLLPDAPTELWGGPRERPRNVHQLHQIAGVSAGKAHDFFHAFADADFVTRDGDLKVVRRDELLQEWRARESMLPPRGVPAWSLWGRPKRIEDIVGQAGGPDYAVASWTAVRRLGLAHARAPSMSEWHVHLLSGSLEDAFRAWQLEPAGLHDAHLWIYVSGYPESIRRGRVLVDGVLTVDGLQAALDVHPRTHRGEEQADYILERLGLR